MAVKTEEYNNSTTITLNLNRLEVCDLLLATNPTVIGEAKKWKNLHDKIKKQLHETDKEHGWK